MKQSQNDSSMNNEPADFIKMMEMAKEFNKYINSNKNGIESQQEKKTSNNTSFIPIEFDEKLQTNEMKAVKAAIPYLEAHNGRKMGIFIKILELQNLIHSYNDSHLEPSNIQRNPDEINRNILKAMRPHLGNEKQEMIDMILKIIELKNIMITLQNLKSSL